MSKNPYNKFEAFILASYLDTIGFLNGYMEFNELNYINNISLLSPEMIHHYNIMIFFKIGGFSLNLKKYLASDDTILNIANGKVLLNKTFNINDFINKYLEYYDILIENRGIGTTTEKSLKNLKKVRSPLSIEYDENSIGNGAVMRSCIFALKYNHLTQLDLLQKWVIDTSKLTHNNVESNISSLITAIFSSMAINKIVPFYWINKLNEIKNNIKFKNKKELDIFNSILEKLEYIINNVVNFNSSFSYSNKKELILYDSTEIINFVDLSKYDINNIGGISYDLLLMSYHILINCISYDSTAKQKIINNTCTVNDVIPNFVYLTMNSSLSYGDSDSLGFICGFWYGALFGFKDVPTNINFKDLEFYNDIEYLAKNI